MSVIKNLEVSVETYTHVLDDREPMEVMLAGVTSEVIGSDNTFEPPEFYHEHITTWMRERYFFLDGQAYAQIPRQMKSYPEVVRDQFEFDTAFATDIVLDDSVLKTYYPIDSEEAICFEWDTTVDHWSMSVVSQPSENGNIATDGGDAKTARLIWSAR